MIEMEEKYLNNDVKIIIIIIIIIIIMWNVKSEVIPVTKGATRTISKSFRQYLSNIPESTKSRNYRK